MVKYKITHGLPSVGWTKMKISRSGGHAPPQKESLSVWNMKNRITYFVGLNRRNSHYLNN